MGIHIASLSGRHGIGDIGDSAQAFITKLASMKIAVWQFLPTGPTAYGDSPYQPLSAFAGNEMLIGIDPLIRLGLLTSTEAEVLTGLSEESVDYASLIPRKQAVLSQAAVRFSAVADKGLQTDYESFLHLNGEHWLNDYAIYRVLKSQHGERPWSEWDAPFRQRDPIAMQKVRADNRDALASIKILQFLFDRQWQSLKRHARENKVILFGDMPIYIALDSSDAWAHPEILLLDENGKPSAVAGVPPDYFSADGQLWGNPLYDWKFHEASGYEWWIERMHHAANQFDLVRIDHFRGLEAFWSVPFAAETARDGEWVKGPGDRLFIALRAALGNLPMVAEDLGVITPDVDALRNRHKIPGMKVLQFEVGDASFNIDNIEDNCVCYTATHDNDTTVGWFSGGEQDTRTEAETIESRKNALRVTGGTADSIHVDLIRLAFESRAHLSIAPMQDFLGLGSEARLNIPGTTQNNWRWRVRDEQLSPLFCQSVANLVEETARA